MQIKRLTFSLFLLVGGITSSCQKPPKLSLIPKIEVESAIFIKNKIISSTPFDTIRVNLKFEDGDGDLGLEQADTSGAFAINSIYNKNFYVDFYIKNFNNTFSKYVFSGGLDYNGRFPLLNPDYNKDQPITGFLRRDFTSSFSSPFSDLNGKTIKLQIYIFDRKLNKSNVVETAEFNIN